MLLNGSLLAESSNSHSFDINEVLINATITKDGHLIIREKRTVFFNGPFKSAKQRIIHQGTSLGDTITIKEADASYELAEKHPPTKPGTYSALRTDNYHTTIYWAFEADNEIKTFIIEYEVLSAVTVRNNRAELHYQFIGNQWAEPTKHVSITLSLPGATDSIEARGHGPQDGTVHVDYEQGIITWEVSPLEPHTFLEGKVHFPAKLVPTINAPLVQEAQAPSVVDEPRVNISIPFRNFIESNQYSIAAVILFLVAINLYFTWRSTNYYSKSTRSDNDYFNIYSMPPELVGYLLHKGTVKIDFLIAGIVNLVQKKVITMDEIQDNAKRDETDYRLIKNEDCDQLNPIEKTILKFLFDNEITSITLSQLQNYCKENPKNFYSFYCNWVGTIEAMAKRENYFIPVSTSRKGIPVILMIMAGIILIPLQIWGLMAAIFLSVIAIIFAVPKTGYSHHGAKLIYNIQRLRKDLLICSKTKNSTHITDSCLEQYIAYALVLGLGKTRLKGILPFFKDAISQELPIKTKKGLLQESEFLHATAYSMATIMFSSRALEHTSSAFSYALSCTPQASSGPLLTDHYTSAVNPGDYMPVSSFINGFESGGGDGMGGGGGDFS